MKVSDAVVEVAARAIADLCGFESPSQKTDARAAVEAALPMVVGEAVAEVRSDQDGDMVIVASKALALGTKLHTLTNLEDAP